MDYGRGRRALASDSRKRRRRGRGQTTAAVLITCALIAVLIAGLLWLSGNGRDEAQATRDTPSLGTTVAAGEPTAHPRQRIGALAEGSVSLSTNASAPPIAELRTHGGKRFTKPVAAFAQIDDWFGTPRQYGTIHSGVDFGLEGMGAVPVSAPCDGQVVEAATDDRYGPHVIIDCGNGWSAVLAYLGRIDATGGQAIVRGTGVGMSDSVDEFVHFEIDWEGMPVDPAGYVDLPPRPRAPETPTPLPVVRTGGVGVVRNEPANDGTDTPAPTTQAPSTFTPETPRVSPSATPRATATPSATPTVRPTATPTPKSSSVPPTQLPVSR